MPTRERRAKMLGVHVDLLPDGRGKGVKAKGAAHYRWNDGRMLSDDGYVKVRVGVEHPLADPNGYAYEHLVVWCSAGNQRPGPGELLHHKNEDKSDNRYSNLDLTSRPAHSAHHIAERGRRTNGQFKKPPAACSTACSTTAIRNNHDLHPHRNLHPLRRRAPPQQMPLATGEIMSNSINEKTPTEQLIDRIDSAPLPQYPCAPRAVVIEPVELPSLPEWSKRDDLGGLVPSEIRTALKDYARAALAARQAPTEAPKEPLSEAQLDHIARSYFAEPHAQENAKNAIHDAFLEVRQAPDSRNVWTDEQRVNYRANKTLVYRCPLCCAKSGEPHVPSCPEGKGDSAV